MDLAAFRVENFKRIQDTGWVRCRDLTALVGKNEAGKSAVLRGLSKIKPSDGEIYDGLREFPRSRFTAEFETRDWPVASVRLALNDDEREELAEIHAPLAETETAVVTRSYSGKYTVAFTPAPPPLDASAARARETVKAALLALADSVAPDGRGDEFTPIKAAIEAALNQARSSLPSRGELTKDQVATLAAAVTAHINEEWKKSALTPVADPLRGLLQDATAADERAAARTWVVETMPQFVYFDRYDVLDSAVHIPRFLQDRANNPHASKVRTTDCLFRHVGLDIEELQRLAAPSGQPEEEAARRRTDERAIRTSSASQAMTREFATWWQQRRHTFRYQLDGDYLRVWVSDDLDPSEIELDQRSQGMQYFFSFFLVFLVEARGAHTNSILLLDEPGTSLHGTAQAEIVKFLNTISLKNQVLYTTHSPFMIDAEHLETVRPVYEDPHTGSTKVSDDVWPKDKDALFPLQAALGYQLVQSLFISKRQVMLEGITDYWLFKALDHAATRVGTPALDASIILVPSGGASRMVPLASMLLGHEVSLVAVLDGDAPGRREGIKVQKVLGDERRTLFAGDYCPSGNTAGETEDLFPADFYLAAVKDVYGTIDLRFNAEEKSIPSIVDRLVALFARKGHGEFEKWKVARALADRIEAEPRAVPPDALAVAGELFTDINSLVAS